MRNPYEDIAPDSAKNEPVEEVEGAMSCQRPGCYGTATDGKYFTDKKLLTWVCPECKKICKIENIEI